MTDFLTGLTGLAVWATLGYGIGTWISRDEPPAGRILIGMSATAIIVVVIVVVAAMGAFLRELVFQP